MKQLFTHIVLISLTHFSVLAIDRVIFEKRYEELSLINPTQTIKNAKVRLYSDESFVIIHTEGVTSGRTDRFTEDILKEFSSFLVDEVEDEIEVDANEEKDVEVTEDLSALSEERRSELLRYVSSACFMDYSIDASAQLMIAKSPANGVYYTYPLDNLTVIEEHSPGAKYTKVVVFQTKDGNEDIDFYLRDGTWERRGNREVDSVFLDKGIEVRKAFLAIIENLVLKSGDIDLKDKRSNLNESLREYLERTTSKLLGVYMYSYGLGSDVTEFPVAVYSKEKDYYYAHISEQNGGRYVINTEWKIEIDYKRFDCPMGGENFFVIKDDGLEAHNVRFGKFNTFKLIE